MGPSLVRRTWKTVWWNPPFIAATVWQQPHPPASAQLDEAGCRSSVRDHNRVKRSLNSQQPSLLFASVCLTEQIMGRTVWQWWCGVRTAYLNVMDFALSHLSWKRVWISYQANYWPNEIELGHRGTKHLPTERKHIKKSPLTLARVQSDRSPESLQCFLAWFLQAPEMLLEA